MVVLRFLQTFKLRAICNLSSDAMFKDLYIGLDQTRLTCSGVAPLTLPHRASRRSAMMGKLSRAYAMAIAALGSRSHQQLDRTGSDLGAEPVLSDQRRRRRPGGLGQDLPAALRTLSQDRRHAAHQAWRQRSRAAHADQGRPAQRRREVEGRGGCRSQGDVAGLCFRDRFPRGPRPRSHAGGSDLYQANVRSSRSPARA